MGAELIVTNVIKIVFLIVGGHLAITKVLPMLEDVLSSVLTDKKVLDGLMSLLSVLILVIVGIKVIDLFLATQNPTLAYIGLVRPAFEVLFMLVDYFTWILAGVVVLLGVQWYSQNGKKK